MKLSKRGEVVSVPGFDDVRDALPFVFLDGYAQYLETTGQGEWLLFSSNNGEILLPARRFRSKFLSIVQLLNAPLDKGERMPAERESEFFISWMDFIRHSNLADRVVQPPTHVVFQKAPPDSESCGFGTWFIPLQVKSESELWDGLHSKHRNVIRNAQKHEVEIREGKDQLEAFYFLYASTMKRSLMYAEPQSQFAKLYDFLGSAHVTCAVAYYKGTPQGGVFMPHSRACAYYMHGGSADAPEVNGAMNYLHWELICRMKKAGVLRYDFVGTRLSNTEGTRLHGIQQFKERFGSSLEKGVLWKTDINTVRCSLYDAILRGYYRIRNIRLKGDIIDQEKRKEQLL